MIREEVHFQKAKGKLYFLQINKKNSRKRKTCVQKWQRSERKEQGNSGKAYNYIKRIKDNDGKIIDRIVIWKEERKLLPPCGDKCRLTCRNKFTEEQRKGIFNEYWKMGDLQRQRDFIVANTAKINPKYRNQRENAKKRSLHNAYYFNYGEKNYGVQAALY
ncbi:uncharacterized protein TNCV_3389531 [Trichonephila clavipes]|nr:uncharacterized protein TNCV_3389531 [Trichonephila clavipes]